RRAHNPKVAGSNPAPATSFGWSMKASLEVFFWPPSSGFVIALCSREHTEIQLYGQGARWAPCCFCYPENRIFQWTAVFAWYGGRIAIVAMPGGKLAETWFDEDVRPVATLRSSGA
ncbi:hypothetical protein AB4084_08300, partial [Lysobacter sp. 2RAB21]